MLCSIFSSSSVEGGGGGGLGVQGFIARGLGFYRQGFRCCCIMCCVTCGCAVRLPWGTLKLELKGGGM